MVDLLVEAAGGLSLVGEGDNDLPPALRAFFFGDQTEGCLLYTSRCV